MTQSEHINCGSREYPLLTVIDYDWNILINCKKNNLTRNELISFKHTCVNPQLLLMLLSICLQINWRFLGEPVTVRWSFRLTTQRIVFRHSAECYFISWFNGSFTRISIVKTIRRVEISPQQQSTIEERYWQLEKQHTDHLFTSLLDNNFFLKPCINP